MNAQKRSCDFLSEFFSEFISNIREVRDPDLRVLYSQKSVFLGEYSPFQDVNHDVSLPGQGSPIENYDLIFLNPSFSKIIANSKENPYVNQITGRLNCLAEEGISFVLLPNFEISLSNKSFVQKLAAKGFFINGVLRLPEGFLRPDTSIRPLLVCISRVEAPITLFVEFEGWEANSFGQFEVISSNLLNVIFQDWKEIVRESRGDPTFISEIEDIDWDDLWNGVYSNFSDFLSFEHWKIEDELKRTNSDYLNFKPCKFADLILEINTIRSGEIHLSDRENCIYIPIVGNQKVVSKISEFKIKPHNYAELVINTESVNLEYLVSFLNSKIGQLKISAAKTTGAQTIPKLSKSKIENLEIRMPNLQTQDGLLAGVKKIQQIYSTVERIKSDIDLNPLSSKDIEKLDSILNSMSEFTAQDKIRHLILVGENKTTEFKETLHLDKKTKEKNKLLEHSVLKTIVGFMNSDGGTLLVGVSDEQKLVGVEEEINKFHKSEDKYLLHFKSLFKRSIGEEFYSLYETQLINIDNRIVMRIDVLPSDKEVFLDGKEFFVRTNPSTDKLEGMKLLEYCKRRFIST